MVIWRSARALLVAAPGVAAALVTIPGLASGPARRLNGDQIA